ncbi:hypothetical protein QMO56_19180 [Roseomonas sp. E05]|uniref:hypothetical protein n=1 Tax=Roseomonas sp. E05 TaxID=3046310 RepID=UPI0024BAC0E0|nr:hypothetical protein [Roseomonas sp. E05]MDJ0390239.1 hypothetical protein [Roseomonas sp. E05]
MDRIALMLTEAGYRPVPTPLNIAGLIFDLPLAFVGGDTSPDLIVVADTAFEPEQRILQKVEGVARALDVVKSKRPLTAVLAGPRPTSPVLDAMSRVCRVLPVGSAPGGDTEAGIRNWLAVLMPLHLPDPSGGIADPLSEIRKHLDGLEPEVAKLVERAESGVEAVQSRLYEVVAEPVSNMELDPEP